MRSPVVLFDVMDTLVQDPFHEELPRAFGYDKQGFLRNKRDGLWPRFERGEIDEDTFVSRCLLEGDPPSIETVHEHLVHGYRWMPGMESLLKRLRPHGVEMHAFSNYPVWYRLIEEALGLSDYLEWSFVSWKTGLRKPAQQAYVNVLNQLGRRSNQCIFVDNRAENCRVARLLGIRSHEFSGADRLDRYLSSFVRV